MISRIKELKGIPVLCAFSSFLSPSEINIRQASGARMLGFSGEQQKSTFLETIRVHVPAALLVAVFSTVAEAQESIYSE
jgi:hypothetical protein